MKENSISILEENGSKTGQRWVSGHCISAAMEMLADDDMTTADEYITIMC